MKRLHYNIIFRPEKEGGFTAVVPSLSGCISYGKTLEEARTNVLDAIDGYINSLIRHKEPIPSDEVNFISSLDYEFSPSGKKCYA